MQKRILSAFRELSKIKNEKNAENESAKEIIKVLKSTKSVGI